jgi:hypothetical protein
VLVETPWRIEREGDGYRLNLAEDAGETIRVFTLGEFPTPSAALLVIGEILHALSPQQGQEAIDTNDGTGTYGSGPIVVSKCYCC